MKPLGRHLRAARVGAGLSQLELAARSGVSQAEISHYERGRRRPSLEQWLRIAEVLDVPVQWLLSGSLRPGEALAEIAIELRHLGIVDLWVRGAVVPGAFRSREEVIALAVAGRSPEPRIVEAIPAVLAWNAFDPVLLVAHGVVRKSLYRLGWLAEVALAIDGKAGFPGACRRDWLESFVEAAGTDDSKLRRDGWDDLGKPAARPSRSPVWKRWRIGYDADLERFEKRARELEEQKRGEVIERVRGEW